VPGSVSKTLSSSVFAAGVFYKYERKIVRPRYGRTIGAFGMDIFDVVKVEFAETVNVINRQVKVLIKILHPVKN